MSGGELNLHVRRYSDSRPWSDEVGADRLHARSASSAVVLVAP
jgi:hypothetical protein